MEVEPDLTAAQLDVYDSREGGVWHPEHRVLQAPAGWELLPSGDAFVTRRVKTAGVYWSLWRPRGRDHPHRRLLGILAPAATVAQAREEAAQTVVERSSRRAQGAAYRPGRRTSTARSWPRPSWRSWASPPSMPAWPAPSPPRLRNVPLRWAAAVWAGPGRSVWANASALAARALIRHRYTDYEERLLLEVWDDEFLYRSVKAEAQDAVDRYLEEHRRAKDLDKI